MWPFKPKNWDDMSNLQKADWYWDSSQKWLTVAIISSIISVISFLISLF